MEVENFYIILGAIINSWWWDFFAFAGIMVIGVVVANVIGQAWANETRTEPKPYGFGRDPVEENDVTSPDDPLYSWDDQKD